MLLAIAKPGTSYMHKLKLLLIYTTVTINTNTVELRAATGTHHQEMYCNLILNL